MNKAITIVILLLFGALFYTQRLILEKDLVCEAPVITTEQIYYTETIIERTINNSYFNKPMVGFYHREAHKCSRNAELFTVTGMSMQPHLWEGGQIWMDKIKGKDARVGDVILFEMESGSAIHAVIGTYPELGFLVTAGYANHAADDIVQFEDVKYRECIKI